MGACPYAAEVLSHPADVRPPVPKIDEPNVLSSNLDS